MHLALENPTPAVDRRRPVRLLELIGNTPLIDLSALTARDEVRLFAKAELANPGGAGCSRAAGGCSTPPRGTPASPTP
jgi:hypothetical protein